MSGIRDYFGNIADALTSTVKGMGVTLHHFTSEPPITVQYPHARLPVPPSYRGVHILEQNKCIDCKLCAKACPVDCIEIEAVHHGRILEWQKFTIDYKKCIFCEFCIPPCPKDCIHMTSEYEMASGDNAHMVEDLLTWTGLRANDKREVDAAEAKKAGKAPPPAPEGGQPGGPAAGNPAPFGTVVTSAHAPGSSGAPGGAPRGRRKSAAPAASAAPPAAPAPAASAAAAPAAGEDMAARVAALKARLAKDKGAG